MDNIGQYKKYEPFFGSWYFEENCREIGSGSFGSVFRVVRYDTHVRPSALKIIAIGNKEESRTLRFQGMSDADIWNYYEQMAEDIKQEYELMSELKGCDNIVSCEDFKAYRCKDRIGYDIMIRMELLMPLINYGEVTKREIGEKEIVRLGIDICKALEKCQVKNIIHRDIKPENIFISQYGNFKLGDFGIARTMERTDMLMSRKGTKIYMAPEVYNTQPYDKTADIYSLGVVLYQMLNDNYPPFLTKQTAKSGDARDRAFIRRINGEELPEPAHGSRRMVDIILKACCFQKEGRYQNPQDMRMDLEQLPIADINMDSIDIFELKESQLWDKSTSENRTVHFFSTSKEEETSLLNQKEKTSLLSGNDQTELLTDNRQKTGKKTNKRMLAIGGSVIALFLAAAGMAGSQMLKKEQPEPVTAQSVPKQQNKGSVGTDIRNDNMETSNVEDHNIATKQAISQEEQLLEKRKLVTELKGEDLKDFSELSDYENLEKLDLSQTDISDLSVVSKLKNLKELNICYTNIEDISPIKKCVNLESLNISYNNENMTNKKVITTLSSMTQLKELDLTGNLVTGTYEDELAELTKLQILYAGSTGISDGKFLKKLKNLKKLSLSSNLMFENLNNLAQLDKMEELDLSVTGVTKLKGIENMKNLKVLNISLTDIKDITILKFLKKLEHVTLSDEAKLKKQVKKLKKTLKNCQFEYI